MKKRLVISGGGTGGHVFPGLAVLEALEGLGEYEVTWIGSRFGMEYPIVRSRGITFRHIPSGKLRRYLSLRNLGDVFRVAAGVIRSLGILRALRPAVVFSKGGFVSVPPVMAAWLLGIPVVSHESDFDPGLATRLNALASKRICVPYPQTRGFFPPGVRSRVVHTGNPVRRDIFRGDPNLAKEFLRDTQGKPVLFVQGGSLGAGQINTLVAENLEFLCSRYYVVHQRGQNPPISQDRPGKYLGVPFLTTEYAHVLAASALVLSRAGAGSLWEMGVTRKPGILVPLTAGSRGDQVRNARHMESSGACIVLPQDGTSEALRAAIEGLDATKLSTMAAAWDSIIVPDGAERVARVIHDLVQRTEEVSL